MVDNKTLAKEALNKEKQRLHDSIIKAEIKGGYQRSNLKFAIKRYARAYSLFENSDLMDKLKIAEATLRITTNDHQR